MSDLGTKRPGQRPGGPFPFPFCFRYRPQVLYIAGVEGTGHHGAAGPRRLFCLDAEVMPMILFPAARHFGSCTLSWWRSLREVLMKTPPSQRRQRLRQLLEASGRPKSHRREKQHEKRCRRI